MYRHIPKDSIKIIQDFVSLWKGIKQRDAEWYKLIGRTIGGSEIAALLGLNPYAKRADILMNKVKTILGENTFKGSEATMWGTMFEDTIAHHVEYVFEAPVIGDDITIQSHPLIRLSPDGYIVISISPQRHEISPILKAGDNFLYHRDVKGCVEPTEEIIMLLEFKCPHSRMPAKLPQHYRQQILMGLGITPFTDYGLYVDACFKKCQLGDLNFTSSFDKSYHAMRYKAMQDKMNALNVMAVGLFTVHHMKGDKPKGITDFGGYCNFTQVLEKIIEKKEWSIRRSPHAYNEDEISDVMKFLEEEKKTSTIIGIIPWKLFDVQYEVVKKDEGFIARIIPLVEKFFEDVDAELVEIESRRDAR